LLSQESRGPTVAISKLAIRKPFIFLGGPKGPGNRLRYEEFTSKMNWRIETKDG